MLFNRAPSYRKKIKSKRCPLAYKVDLMPFFLNIHVCYQIRGCYFEEMFHIEYGFEHYFWRQTYLELHIDRYYNYSNLEYFRMINSSAIYVNMKKYCNWLYFPIWCIQFVTIKAFQISRNCLFSLNRTAFEIILRHSIYIV